MGSIDLGIMGEDKRHDLYADATLTPAQTALVIVDMQNYSANRHFGLGRRFAEEGHTELIQWRFDRIEQLVVPNLRKLLAAFRAGGVRVIYVTLGAQSTDLSDAARHMKHLFAAYSGVRGTPESEILNEIAPEPGEFVFNKTTVGAFASTSLDFHLRRQQIRHLLFAGVSTSACVGHTACFAADLEYDCEIIEDACADLAQSDHDWFLRHFQKLFGRVTSTEVVIKELQQGSRASPQL